MSHAFCNITHSRSRRSARVVAGLVIALALVSAAGAAAYYWNSGRSSAPTDVQRATVVRGPFILEITEKGELESSGNTEIRCEVKSVGGSGSSIIKIVPEGTLVKEGDFLVQLDSSRLELDQATQQIAVNTSEALVVQASNTYETALIAKEEYLQGTFFQEQQAIQSEIFVAEENLRRAQEYLRYSRRLAASGYITQLQLDADAFAVDNARNGLASTRTKLNVLENFTRAKMLKTLESAIVTAKAQWEAEKKSHSVELSKLKDIDDQIAKCHITAPAPGQVKYAHKSDFRGNNEFVIEEGSLVREHQVIISLPDPSRMQVKVNVNESVLDSIREGMPAAIRSVSLDDSVLTGHVTKINQYSEPSSWRKGDVKEFAVFVKVDGGSDGRLLPGMTSEVTIRCLEVPDVLKVPIQAVYAHGDQWYCFVQHDNQWEAKPVKPGANNETFVVIADGVAEGDVVTLNPARFVDDVDLPKLSAADQQQVVRRSRLPIGTSMAKSAAPPAGSSSGSLGASIGAKGKAGKAKGPGGSPASMVAGMLANLDTNGDGKLSVDEFPAPMRDRFPLADTNSDGAVDRGELVSAMAKFRAAAEGGGAGGPGGAGQ